MTALTLPQPKLLPFQEAEIAPLIERKRGGIAWDMGLGKTAGASTIGARARLRRWLVICPDNAFAVWRDEAPRWIKASWPEVDVNVVWVQGNAWERETIWGNAYKKWAHLEHCIIIYVVTPDSFIRDWGDTMKVPGKKKKIVRLKPHKDFMIPQIVIWDEAKRFRNPDSIAFQVFQRFMNFYSVQWYLSLTGTPGHEPKHFWTALTLIDRKMFRSYWQFIETFYEINDGFWGKEIIGQRNLPMWHKTLKRYFSVVKEDDEGIAEQRPPLTRQLLSIEMEEDQAKIYNELKNDLASFVEADDKLVYAQNEFALATRLRQVLVCPKILSPSLGIGAAIKDFGQTVEPGQHAVIFTPFTDAFEPFNLYLVGLGFSVQTLQGGIGTEEREARISLFRSTRGVIICSVLYAQAFSLEPATRAFFIGYDWDPDNNRQAEKRLHRLTTQNPISAYYYTFRSTFDERLCDIVNIKQQKVNINIPGNLRSMLT